MKKIICCILALLCVITLCSCNTEYTHGVYKIEITSKCIEKNHVGNEWSQIYWYKDELIESGDKITAELGSKITIAAVITEEDKYEDVGTGAVEIELSDEASNSTYVYVEERGGRFRGNVAKWKVTATAKLVRKTNIKEDK